MPNEDRTAQIDSDQGYFVADEQAQARGGVGNYVDRDSAMIKQEAGVATVIPISADEQMLNSLRQKPEKFLFDTDDAAISPSDHARLDRVASALKSDPDAKLNIRGSMGRSSSVAAYLEEKGVSSSQLKTQGMGSPSVKGAVTNNPNDRAVEVQVA